MSYGKDITQKHELVRNKIRKRKEELAEKFKIQNWIMLTLQAYDSGFNINNRDTINWAKLLLYIKKKGKNIISMITLLPFQACT